MVIKTISIIGGTGHMGSTFANAFKEKGYEVIVSSRRTEIKPVDAVKKSDLVIISVPIESIEEVIENISGHMNKNSTLMDFSSVKVLPCKLMKSKFKGEVIGGHPLFGPGLNPIGHNIVLCPIRKMKNYNDIKKVFESIGLSVIEMTPDEHDKELALIQCLNHFTNITFAKFAKDHKFDLNSRLMTPALKLKLSVIGRMLSQESSLYPNILTYNPYSSKIIKEYKKTQTKISKLVSKKDRKSLTKEIDELKEYFGNESEKARMITNRVLNELNSNC